MPLKKQKNQSNSQFSLPQPKKGKAQKFIDDIKAALLDKNKEKLTSILDGLNVQDLLREGKGKSTYTTRSVSKFAEDVATEDNSTLDRQDDAANAARQGLEKFVKKFTTNVPDPIVRLIDKKLTRGKAMNLFSIQTTSKGLGMNYHNLTLRGLSDVNLCGAVKRELGLGSSSWKASICMPMLSASVGTTTGPGVPFRGRVNVLLRRPKISLT